MVWVNNINELEHYRRRKGEYCYCDLIVYPNDLVLQGRIEVSSLPPEPYILVTAHSVDGLTYYGDITIAFEYYIAKQGGVYYFVARLKYIPAALCLHSCFILRVKVFGNQPVAIFDKYTEQYCLASCCMLAQNVRITGENVIDYPISLENTLIQEDVQGCHPLLRMSVKFDCIDNYTGDFWNIPPSTIVGTAFAFTKTLNIRATKKLLPRNIEVFESQNCKTQKTQSTRLWEVQSFEQFPLWKMDEIELMLHANYIEVAGDVYKFPGGAIFSRLRNCRDYFRLVLPLKECSKYQIFGCFTSCDPDALYYGFKEECSVYKDEDGNKIASSKDELIVWLRNQPGVTSVEEVEPDLTFSYAFIVYVENGSPTPIHACGTVNSGALLDPDNPNFYELFGLPDGYIPCPVPVIGEVTSEDPVCPIPQISEPEIEFILMEEGSPMQHETGNEIESE